MRRSVVVSMIGLITFFGSSSASYASVSLSPITVARGQNADFTFVVGNQTQSPATNVNITFPDSPTVNSVNATGPSGWTSTVYAESGPVTGVDFSAGSLAPGTSGAFILTFVAPNSAAAMTFKIQQKYADGTTTTPDSTILDVTTDGPTTTTEAATSTSVVQASTTTTTSVPVSTSSRGSSGIRKVGQVLIALGLAVGVAMYLRARRIK